MGFRLVAEELQVAVSVGLEVSMISRLGPSMYVLAILIFHLMLSLALP